MELSSREVQITVVKQHFELELCRLQRFKIRKRSAASDYLTRIDKATCIL